MTNSAKWLFNVVDDLIVENCIVKKKSKLIESKFNNNNLYLSPAKWSIIRISNWLHCL